MPHQVEVVAHQAIRMDLEPGLLAGFRQDFLYGKKRLHRFIGDSKNRQDSAEMIKVTPVKHNSLNHKPAWLIAGAIAINMGGTNI